VAEAVARALLCLLAWWVPSSSAPWLLAAAIGVPILVSAAVARWRLSPAPSGVVAAPDRGHATEQSFITAVALLSQIAVNSAPLWLAVRAADPALAGQFVSATSYLRIPIFFVGGLGTVALSAVSSAHGGGDLLRARRTTVRSASAAAVVGAIGVVTLLVLSRPALLLLTGARLRSTRGRWLSSA
jgi:O-antigen/teichoic acid export membrane protein